MDLAQIPDSDLERRPYRGRGKPGTTTSRSPLPEHTSPSSGEEHGKTNAWAARSRRCKELARLRTQGKHDVASKVAQAIIRKGPRNPDEL